MNNYNVVIAGAGQAGVQTAISLHQAGYTGSIALLSAEDTEPYERPPLSKSYLAGDDDLNAILFRTPGYWDESPVTLRTAARVVAVDAEAHTVTTSQGEAIGYGYLVWAAGGTARTLPIPGHDLRGVLSIRDLQDANELRSILGTAQRAVIIGGGYVGLEAAAAFRGRGIATTIIEAQDRLLARTTSPVISDFFAQVHRANGVDIILNGGVSEILGNHGHVTSVRLADRTQLEADLVIVGIGLVPNVDPIAGAGGNVDNGVVVDAYCRTDLPDIFAVGDVARHPNIYSDGESVRLESVQNAIEQAKLVADYIRGEARPYEVVPWFWSNQYDARLKTVGLLTGYDELVVRGNPSKPGFTVVYLRAGQVIALDCVNTPVDFAHGRVLIERGVSASAEARADTSRPLKTLVGVDRGTCDTGRGVILAAA